ncbi:glycosyltransferase [Microvirga arsenatis]|uniref:Glycosyltransferase n=1 Tax=Microvirga arsenatis TaxID=2692265 RepID=A0ABW9YXH3_9HYPH|nr:glycosyltransferase [Microvirga arsenatis]NBJ10211.1 glycosyltransferase [Microvirga arsenatis]NBJ24890.1 glycosyltransferase [Microvirga arsenatis]
MGETDFHASIILTIHRESIYLRRTLLSLDEAARFAQDRGLRLELVAVLDRTDEATRSVLTSFDLGTYHGHQIMEVDHGSVGLARNAGVARARGAYIFTADADDLVSYNYFHDIYRAAERGGAEALFFPEYMLGFGCDTFICHYKPLADVTPIAFVHQHPFTSRLCAHHSVFRRVAYQDIPLSRGYAYEDWHFNAEAVGLGLDILVVPNTILFYRQREGSLLKASHAISVRQIPPTRLFQPLTYLEISSSYREDLGRTDRSDDSIRSGERDFLLEVTFRLAIQRANAIEPLIILSKYQDERTRIFSNYETLPHVGLSYYTLCDIIRDRKFSDVFLLPFMPVGGAEKYLLSLMEVFYQIDPFSNFLVILGEDIDGVQRLENLPPNAVVIDMALHSRSLSIQERCLLTLKIIETCSPKTRIHMRQSRFADKFLDLYGAVLSNKETIYYRFCDLEHFESGYSMIVYSPLDLICKNIHNLSKIVTDGTTVIKKDHQRLGIDSHKWHCLPAPVETPAILKPRIADAQRRILWASRLDFQKRPSLLPLIAAQLGKSDPDLTIDVFGGSVLDGFDLNLLQSHQNLKYHGLYSGFESLPLTHFSIFLYTSLYDGVPNVLLEAMSHGLAVVAPDLGGIPEIVHDGETGILLPSLPDDEAMAASYAKALLALSNDPERIARLGSQARAFVLEHHSPEVHAQRVAAVFGLQPRRFQHAAEV